MSDCDEPAGPFTNHTRCLICGRFWIPDEGWVWCPCQVEVDPTYIFAGYFCTPGCADHWKACNETQRSFLLFGDPEKVNELRVRLAMAEADPKRPDMKPVRRETRHAGSSVPLMSDESRIIGWRQPLTAGPFRLW